MIIVEGPDGSGKSSLIEALGMKRWHFKSLGGGVGGDSPEGWGQVSNPVKSYQYLIFHAKNDRQAVAFDRFHLSERVYGPMLRGKQLIDDPTLERIGAILRDMHIPLILCLPPLEVTLDNTYQAGRGVPWYQTPEFLTRAYRGFQELAPWATIVYDYTVDPLPALSAYDKSF